MTAKWMLRIALCLLILAEFFFLQIRKHKR